MGVKIKSKSLRIYANGEHKDIDVFQGEKGNDWIPTEEELDSIANKAYNKTKDNINEFISVDGSKTDNTRIKINNNAEELEVMTKQEWDVLSAKIDAFQRLPEGTTAGNEELINIRIGADGKTYSSAGDAVRGQITELKEELARQYGSKIDKPTVADNNKFPRSNNGDVEWVEFGLPTDEQTDTAIQNWLNAHPEATTTVQDGSLTYEKFKHGVLSYVTPEMFGAKGDGVTDDTESIKNALSLDLPDHCFIVFSKKTYCVSSVLNIANKNIRFNGCTLKRITNGSVIDFSNSVNFVLENLTVTDNGRTYGNMVVGNNCENITIRNLTIISTSPHKDTSSGNWATSFSGNRFHISGLYIDNYDSGLWADGLHFAYVTNSLVEDFTIISGDDSIVITEHEGGGSAFANVTSENVRFVNGVLKSKNANAVRLGFDNSGNRPYEEIDKIYHKNITFENIFCECKYFIRQDLVKHNTTNVVPNSPESISFVNVTYKATNEDVSSYPFFYVSPEYTLKNWKFTGCDIDLTDSVQNTTQPFIYLNSQKEDGSLYFNTCKIDLGARNFLYRPVMDIIDIRDSIVKTNGTGFVINANSNVYCKGCKFINYAEKSVTYVLSQGTDDRLQWYEFFDCLLENIEHATDYLNRTDRFLRLDNVRFTKNGSINWHSGNASYSNVQRDKKHMTDSSHLFIYVPANGSVNYSTSGFSFIKIRPMNLNAISKDVIIRCSDNIIVGTPQERIDLKNMLETAGLSVKIENSALTITNTNSSYTNCLVDFYSQTN